MSEISTINVVVKKDLIDYLLIIVPIILSIIAIWISVDTANRQTKISLFKRRYKVYDFLRFIGLFHAIEMKKYDLKKLVENKNYENGKYYTTHLEFARGLTYDWASMRIYHERDYLGTRGNLVATEILAGEYDSDLINKLESCLRNDMELLGSFQLLFDEDISEIIDKTARSYFLLCQQMICICRLREYSIDVFNKTLIQFLEVSNNWENGSNTMNKLERIIRL